LRRVGSTDLGASSLYPTLFRVLQRYFEHC